MQTNLCIICCSQICVLAWLSWAGLIRLGGLLHFPAQDLSGWNVLPNLPYQDVTGWEGVPDLPEQDLLSCLGKLDVVGPIDKRPSTDILHHFVQKKQKKHVTHYMTRDTWHMTCDTWHVTRDMLEGGTNILSKFWLLSSYCLWFMILWRYGGKGSLTHSLNDEAVYRTVPATPALLIRHTSQPDQSCSGKAGN